MEIISREFAVKYGRNKYFTGKPCKHGHIAERYVTTCMCTGCIKANYARLRQTINGALAGIHPFTFRLHADDHAAAHAFCNALNMQRGLPPEADPTALPVAPPQPRRFDLWERTHGRPRALLMLSQAGAQDDYERKQLSGPTNGS